MKVMNTQERRMFAVIRKAFAEAFDNFVGRPLAKEDIERMREAVKSWRIQTPESAVERVPRACWDGNEAD